VCAYRVHTTITQRANSPAEPRRRHPPKGDPTMPAINVVDSTMYYREEGSGTPISGANRSASRASPVPPFIRHSHPRLSQDAEVHEVRMCVD
jgi:hypothetical protein